MRLCTVEINAANTGEIIDSLERVVKLVKDGYTSGAFDDMSFQLSGEERQRCPFDGSVLEDSSGNEITECPACEWSECPKESE